MQNQAHKQDAKHAKTGPDGEHMLARGHKIALRHWHERPEDSSRSSTSQPYEILGYLIRGSLTITIEGQQDLVLVAGDSWSIPPGVSHAYQISDDIEVIEAITV